jgi:signal transduction histidine kinase
MQCKLGERLPPVSADRDRVVQLLSNYLNNAIKFTPNGGRIQVSAQAAEGGGVRFAVRDSGPGIKAEDISNVFNRFWQVKRTAHLGSGVGLTIARGIAEAHGGRVWVESTPGDGSTFYFELPHSAECAQLTDA